MSIGLSKKYLNVIQKRLPYRSTHPTQPITAYSRLLTLNKKFMLPHSNEPIILHFQVHSFLPNNQLNQIYKRTPVNELN